jgi:hypothetical protein
MAGDDDATCGEVKTTVTLMGRGVPEEDAGGGTGRQLVASRGGHIRVAKAPKDTEMGIVWGGAIQQRVGNAVASASAQKEGGMCT